MPILLPLPLHHGQTIAYKRTSMRGVQLVLAGNGFMWRVKLPATILFVMLSVQICWAQTPPRGLRVGQQVDLQSQLEKGLQARLPEEFAYLRRVVQLVQQRRLPLTLVRSTFDYARDKRPYPFQYFKRALQVRAARQGFVVN